MSNLFIVHTPYHLMLAIGIVLFTGNNSKKNTLYLVRDFDINSIDINKIKTLFNKVIILRGNTDIQNSMNTFNNLSLYRNNISLVKETENQSSFERIYVFNDSYLLVKKIIQYIRESSQSEVVYVEDGSAAYNGGVKTTKMYKWKWKIKALLFGLREYGEPVTVFGTSGFINRCMVLYPELVNSNLKTKNIEVIPSNCLRLGIDFLYKNTGIKSFDKRSVLIFLDIYSFIHLFENQYKDILQLIINHLDVLKYPVYVKYHPRESNFYIDNILKRNVTVIDNNIPSEALISNCDEETVIFSSISTCLITARKLMSQAKLISIMKLLDINDENLCEVFENLKIAMPENSNDLTEILQANLNVEE